ncbi:MAG: hypothetical protein CVU59_02595 [Deltaproteobacteria bacterium HGW-Deltaproteobacteria-17]|nr:MAG: hypothetical protein CVU59_02595 [Deltaproteobacteria bacterium HGW-Deltaproteobacteria-17]
MTDFTLSPDQMDPDALFVVRQLQRHRHTAYMVGGSIRDLLVGRTPKDYDVSTSATPREIRRIFNYARVIGRRFKLVHVVFKNNKIIETSTFRKAPEHDQNDEAEDLLIRDDNLYGTPEEDAFRRDFTINGLFYDPRTERIIDFVEGLPDIEARLIRCIGDPDIRFQEDPVRILRALRFAAKLDFTIEENTLHHMQLHRDQLKLAAPRRVRDETWKLLLCGRASTCVDLARSTGVLQILAPELVPSFEDPRLGARIHAMLQMFDDGPPEDPRLFTILMAPILFHAQLEPLWDILDAPWKTRNDTLELVSRETLEPMLLRFGFSKFERAVVRDLLQIVIRLGHPEHPVTMSERIRERPLFPAALRLWEWTWTARGLPEDLLERANLVVHQGRTATAVRRRRRRHPRRKPEVSPS